MSQFWESQLHAIREEVLLMCGLAERNLDLAMRALTERDDRLADLAEAEDAEIDQLEIRIDEMVVTFISTHAVVASDTRFVLTACKIAANLERIADEATTIARRARDLNGEPPLGPMNEIPIMAITAQEMLRAAINAFVEKEPDEAVEIIARDKTVDDIYRQLVRDLTAHDEREPEGDPARAAADDHRQGAGAGGGSHDEYRGGGLLPLSGRGHPARRDAEGAGVAQETLAVVATSYKVDVRARDLARDSLAATLHRSVAYNVRS